MINNIIFDFDGVLVDSEILVAKSFTKYLNNAGFPFEEKEFFKFAGLKTFEVISILAKNFTIKNEKKFYDEIMNIASNVYSNDLETVAGAYEFVRDTKFNIFIGSNSVKKRILNGLKKVKLDKYIKSEQVYSFDMVNKPKPFPDIYLKVIEENNLNKNETIIIEDSSVGVKAGVAANVKVIGLTAGGHWFKERNNKELFDAGATDVTDDFNKIISLIEKY